MWMGDLNGYSRTWSKQEIVEISAALNKCNITRPLEIHRCIRNLDVVHHWKATEFRVVLLYVGIAVLKNRVSEAEYELFKILFCAVTICTSMAYRRYLPVARNLFNDFIEKHIAIYEEHSITMNIHNLSHVVDDVENFGPLPTISAYEFENSLHHLKLRLKQCNKPLQQITRRISELAISSSKVTALKPAIFFPKCDRPFVVHEHDLAYKQIEFKQNAILSSVNANGKDKWFLTHDNIIVEFHFVNNNIINGSPLKNTENFFNKPFDSKHLNIFLSDGELDAPKYFKLIEIKAKMFSMSYENKFLFVPLIHTL